MWCICYFAAAISSVATVRPVPNPSAGINASHHTWRPGSSTNTATVKPNNALNGIDATAAERHRKKPKSALKNRRNEPRRQTISSSQPAWFEQSPHKGDKVTSAAGELMTGDAEQQFKNVVKSSSVSDVNFDDETIDKMIVSH